MKRESLPHAIRPILSAFPRVMRLASRVGILHLFPMHPVPPRVRFGLPQRRTALGACLVFGITSSGLAQTSLDPGFPRSSGERGTFPDSAPRIVERFPVFFPPSPPALGRPVTRGIPPGGRYPAPPELADYVSDFFYPALGTRLVTRGVNEKLRARLDAYRAAKLALLNELRTELDRLRTAEPAARLEALATLARRQTPKIVELEKTAEQLRRDLVTGENNWSAVRQWHLSDKHRRGYSPIEIAQVMRAFAFYSDGLLPAQRRLLREIAIELVFAAENTAAATAAQPFLFFPPEPARVLLPDDLPAEVARKVAAYQTMKSGLKKELYDTVHAADGAAFGFLRGSPLKALADKQSSRLAELDTLAEEIRRGLSQAPPPRAARSPLPADLDGRVATLIASYQSAQAGAATKIDAILVRAKDLPMQASYRFEAEALKFMVVPTRGARSSRGGGALSRIEAVRSEISAVADEYGRNVADMINERDSIRTAIGQSLKLTKPEEIDRALLAAMRLANQKYAESTFSEYRIAVFEPGLSPEQRRLLFDGVVERLELPLPRGDLQPASRADTW